MKRLFVVAVAWLIFLPPMHVLAQEPLPKHLIDAQYLVQHLNLNNTNYEHAQGKVVWSGTPESHTDCSGPSIIC